MTKSQTRSKENSRSVSGKVFLFGEYAVLRGYPAVVATLEAECGRRFTPGVNPFGGGGFGASSAEFILESSRVDPLEVYREYRARGEDALRGTRPSGVDVLAQMVGGVIRCSGQDERMQFQRLAWQGALPIEVFWVAHRADRKVFTHEHLSDQSLLERLTETRAIRLGELADAGWRAIENQNGAQIGELFDQADQALEEYGFSLDRNREPLSEVRKIPGVWGAKGSGALGADVWLVALDSEKIDRQALKSWSERHDVRSMGMLRTDVRGVGDR